MNTKHQSSFRDPSGFIFEKDGQIFRQVNFSYKKNYDRLIDSGLYKNLVDEELLLPHKEISVNEYNCDAYKILKPVQLEIITYPYEWCFSQLKDAALLTLQVQRIALEYGMIIKDASAYNVQFYKGKPIFIDTLSFEEYSDGTPWIAYKQFCTHFLSPLALISYCDTQLIQLLKSFLDGIPLDLARKLLPYRSRSNLLLILHLFLHSKSQKYYENRRVNIRAYSLSRFKLLSIIDSLQTGISKLKWKPKGSEWGNYYSNTNYSDEAIDEKKKIVKMMLSRTSDGVVFDIGGNIGLFSRLVSSMGRLVVCTDLDYETIEQNYLYVKQQKIQNIIPLILDITNPSPGIGLNNSERQPFTQRIKIETILALAVIHHLVISNNIPIARIVKLFSEICRFCIIEWVPKEDSQVQKILSTRNDIYSEYSQDAFEREFSKQFDIIDIADINETKRKLYLLKNRFTELR